ncbi:dabb-domain-containing protein [Karstenula rhodostoma CBS 690.94]|uniref:Dabb-domain-containing protein n=1 Tax=Karstenula rhodostoma CBS 690.94 TaxID=1392251 RepID=A0A9P4PCN6_9PLEO|nr:dabb-domain-containing protein [Karstenula rhodostoma CBS 690.94]
MGAALCLLVLIIFLLAKAHQGSFASIFATSSFKESPQAALTQLTTHIVLFKFKDGVASADLKDITLQMLSLQKSCIHPTTGAPYITSITGGKNNSPENLQEGLSHAFILQFSSNEDRDYYANQDPVHDAFKKAAGPSIEKAVVVDFQNGVFMHKDIGI